MRATLLTLAIALGIGSVLSLPSACRADPPRRVIELGPFPITARGPTVFTTIPRARIHDRAPELRAHLAREVPPTVRRDPF